MATKTAHVFIGDKNWTKDESHLQSTEEQLELFLIKYPSMDRDNLKYIVEVRSEEPLLSYFTYKSFHLCCLFIYILNIIFTCVFVSLRVNLTTHIGTSL